MRSRFTRPAVVAWWLVASAASCGGEPGDGPSGVEQGASTPVAAAALVPRTPVRPTWLLNGLPKGPQAASWDGRLFLGPGFDVTIFRPEALDQTRSTTPTLPQLGVPGFFGGSGQKVTALDALTDLASVRLLKDTLASGAGHGAQGAPFGLPFAALTLAPGASRNFSTLAVAQDPRYAENPEDRAGEAVYHMIVYATSLDVSADCVEPRSSPYALGAFAATVHVSSPRTAQAHVARAELSPWTPMTLAEGIPLPGGARLTKLCARHPTVTADGRLVVFEDGGFISYTWNGGDASVPGWYERGWTPPRDITKMFHQERASVVDGVPFERRYPIARSAMMDGQGRPYRDAAGAPIWTDGSPMGNTAPLGIPSADRHLYNGGYPWITPDGTDVISASVGPWEFDADPLDPSTDTDGPQRAATASIGEHSAYAQRHVDCALNSNRGTRGLLKSIRDDVTAQYLAEAGASSVDDLPRSGHTKAELRSLLQTANGSYVRTIMTSPGPAPSMWGPYHDVRRLQIPYQRGRFVVPIVGSNRQYDEFNYDDTADGNYLVFMHMREALTRTVQLAPSTAPAPVEYTNETDLAEAYAKLAAGGTKARYRAALLSKVTADSSGHPRTVGTLNADARFPVEHDGRDEIVGAVGQAVYFAEAGAVTLANDDQLDEARSSNAVTVQLFVKRLVDGARRAPAADAFRRSLVAKPGLFDVTMAKDGSVEVAVHVMAQGRPARRALQGITGDALSALSRCGRACGAASLPWAHVAFTYNGANGRLAAYVDGRLVAAEVFGPAPLGGQARGPMVIGPAWGGDPVLRPREGYVMIDEVAVSNLVRPVSDLEASAYMRPPVAPVRQAAAGVALPLGLSAEDLGPVPTYAVTPAMVTLGRGIFSDPRLSRNRQVACQTCHDPGKAFTDGVAKAVGLAVGPRNSPSIQNRAFGSLQFWDGRANSVEAQVTQPFLNPVEMGLASLDEAVTVLSAPGSRPPGSPLTYAQLFADAQLPITADSLSVALGAFVRTSFAGGSRVDRFEAGNASALDAEEKRGRALFRGKARCVSCHSGSNYSDERFHRTGIAADALSTSPDLGRFKVTGLARDYGAFRTPSLRNVAKTGPYMHDGSVGSPLGTAAANLSAVVARYDAGAPRVARVDSEIFPLGLDADERRALVKFLLALSSP